MQHFVHALDRPDDLTGLMADGALRHAADRACSVLFQVFLSVGDRDAMLRLSAALRAAFPGSRVVGCTTIGEIAADRALSGGTVISASCFEASRLRPLAMPVAPGEESTAGQALGRALRQDTGDLQGVLLLSTPLSIDCNALLLGLEATAGGLPVFGGGAGDYAGMKQTLVLLDDTPMSQGVVAVALCGEQLRIERYHYLGWAALGGRMTVTESDGLCVKSIDGEPAANVYKRYLGVDIGDDFFMSSLEFPLLVQRNELLIARVPVSVSELGELRFIANIERGESVRIGYGNVELIEADLAATADAATRFGPQGIYLYSCGCRRFLMQDSVDTEIRPFNHIAPTAGFFTYGEFCTVEGRYPLLNSALVAVALREGPAVDRPMAAAALPAERDLFKRRHLRILKTFIHFLSRVTGDLESANQSLTVLAERDGLTGLYNRRVFSSRLQLEIARHQRHGHGLSVILCDVDHFKRVNDQHGHHVGDQVLQAVAGALSGGTRSTDTPARYGGEEFAVLLPETEMDTALQLAERLRAAIATVAESHGGDALPQVTSSFGVATLDAQCSTADELMRAADAALYRAKAAGRNTVRCAPTGSTG